MLVDNLPLLALSGNESAVLVFICAMVSLVVSAMLRHQRRMAEIIHGTASQHNNSEITQLRQEVYELKQLVHQQTIALDSYAGRPSMPVEVPLQRRLEER